PLPTGSLSCVMTIGILEVASLTARVADGPPAMMTSTLRRTSSAAISLSRSSFPSAYRDSMTMFFPSAYPSSRNPCRNASMRATLAESEPVPRYPIRGTFFGCCSSAMTATARSTTAIRIDGTAAFFITHLVLGVMYHADRDKGKCDLYGGRHEGSLNHKSSRIQSLPGHDSGFSRFTPLIYEKRPPRDVRRQISDVASDARKISLTGIVDKTGRLFAGLQIPQRFKQESSNLDDVRVAHPEVLFGSVYDWPHTLRRTRVLV